MKERVYDIFNATLKAVKSEGHALPFVVSKSPVNLKTLGLIFKLCQKYGNRYFGMGADPYTFHKYTKMCEHINMVVQTVCNHQRALLTQPAVYERDGRLWDVGGVCISE